ncbi:putative F-box-like domain superfamily protein [Tanacetum coccineum]
MFIEMVQVYYEEAERSLQGKGPKDEVVRNSSGTAHVKDPLGHEGMTVEIESALEGRSQEAERSLQGKGPKDEVVGNSSGTAHVKDPLGHEGMTVEIESALEGRSQDCWFNNSEGKSAFDECCLLKSERKQRNKRKLPVIGVIRIDLLGLYKFVDAMGGYMNVTFNDEWDQVANILGLASKHHETVKEVYKEYIGMMKVYYEEAKRSRQGKPEDVAASCSGTAGKERPHVNIHQTIVTTFSCSFLLFQTPTVHTRITMANQKHNLSSEVEADDAISNMPDNVISHIMDLLPIHDAVRTSILSKSFRFKWTLRTVLVFDCNFFDPGLQGKINSNEKIISRILHCLKGSVTKFVLKLPKCKMLDDEDVCLWVMFLSEKGIKELTIINLHPRPLMLHTYIFSCLGLIQLTIRNCCLYMPLSFYGFPKLWSLDLFVIEFKTGNIERFITQCPLLKSLIIHGNSSLVKLKSSEIKKLKTLKFLRFPLCNLEEIAIKISDIFELVSFLPELEVLVLNAEKCKFNAEAICRRTSPATLPCLKNLALCQIDFSSFNAFSCAYDIIWSFPNLQTLTIAATYKDDVPTPLLSTYEVDSYTSKNLQLERVTFSGLRGSEAEVSLIKSILACSPLLKRIAIYPNASQMFGGDYGKLMFATNLLNLHRASPKAEVNIFWPNQFTT